MKNSILFLRTVKPFITIALIATLSACSSLKKVNKELKRDFSNIPEFNQSFSGFALMDPENNKMLVEFNSQKYFTPASNIKLFTFYAGLKVLGDSLPALTYSIQNDSLIFQGTGDPSFLYTETHPSKVYEFLKNRRENLYYQSPIFIEEAFGPGWSWDDFNYYYSVERTAFPIFGNYVAFTLNPSLNKPTTKIKKFQDSLIFSEKDLEIKRDLEKNIFRYNTSELKEETTQIVPFKYSAELFTQLLTDTLKKPVELLTEKWQKKTPPKILYSLPSDSLYKPMLRNSDNFIAEQLLMMVGNEVSDSLSAEKAIKFIKKNYLNDLPDEPIWVDGSGLSRYNLVTPRSMVFLLKKIKEEIPQEKLFYLLPAGGQTGTLKNWYKAEEPYIFAKTGTLSNNHNLSGFIKTKSGKILAFSFMNNNYVLPTSEIKKTMEKFLLKIRNSY